jgi:peroxiredoxin
VATVSYDSVQQLASFAKRRKIGFTLLSDPKSEIIREFGLLNERHAPGSAYHGIPHPMILMVDRKGVVRARFSEIDYSRRPDIDAVLRAAR